MPFFRIVVAGTLVTLIYKGHELKVQKDCILNFPSNMDKKDCKRIADFLKQDGEKEFTMNKDDHERIKTFINRSSEHTCLTAHETFMEAFKGDLAAGGVTLAVILVLAFIWGIIKVLTI